MRNSNENLISANYRFKKKISWKRNLRLWWQNYQWQFIGVFAFLILVLGYVGFVDYFNSIGEARSPWGFLYLSLQLFMLESGAISEPLNWELQLARFLAPAIGAYAALQALALIFREQLEIVRLKFLGNYIVICGLSQRGRLFTERFLEQGYPVVVIELDEKNNMIKYCRDYGAIVLIGNATDKKMLLKAGVDKAKYLISVCGNDGTNAEVAVNAREISSKNKDKKLTCFAHIFNPQLCHLLREREIETGQMNIFKLEFFNIFDIGARSLLIDYPPFSEDDKFIKSQPHILIVGVGRMGESLVFHAATEWEKMYSKFNKKLRITVIDKIAKCKKELLYLRYPKLERICDITPLQIDVNSPDFQCADFLFDENNRCNITRIYICLDNDSLALSTALTLNQFIRNQNIPIVARMISDTGLATLLRAEDKNKSHFKNIYAFGLLERTCQPNLILGETKELPTEIMV